MIRNALAAMLLAPAEGRNDMAMYLASDPVTHADGSVTWNPPTRFDHEFDGLETIRKLPQSEVMEACRKLFDDAGLDVEVTVTQKGCAVFKGSNGTIIVVDKPYRGVTPEAAIRHERGHLNGWPSDHPD